MRTYAAVRQTLIFDGDDCLWENNVYFERAIDDFVAYLDHSTLAPAEVRAVLDEIEHANSRRHGCGAAVFGCGLCQCYEHLAERPLGDEELRTILGSPSASCARNSS